MATRTRRRRTCAHCSVPITQGATGRPRLFCSASCREMAHRRRKARRPARNSWFTPEPLRTEVKARWPIALDAAAEEASHLVDAWLGLDHPDPARRDALGFEHWGLVPGFTGGAVWLNPPYRPRPAITAFTAKAAATGAAGITVIGLVPASVDAAWWREHVNAAGAAVEFLPRRLRFDGPHASGYQAPWPCALIIWGPGS